MKSARALGIPVGFPVFSWDNLTTKGIVHVHPDCVFVWNDVQKREATEYYGFRPRSVVITGAPRFDSFLALTAFDRARGVLPEVLLRSVGADRDLSVFVRVRRRARGRVRGELD